MKTPSVFFSILPANDGEMLHNYEIRLSRASVAAINHAHQTRLRHLDRQEEEWTKARKETQQG